MNVEKRRYRPILLRKEPFSTKLPLWIIDWLRNQTESQSVLIEKALQRTYKIKPPAEKDLTF